MRVSEYLYHLLKKSQLTGFFVFLLAGCQPQPDPEQLLIQQAQTDAAAAVSLAGRRLAKEEYQSALFWFRQAGKLGDGNALEHALQLQQRLEGKLATARWLENQEQHKWPVAAVSSKRLAELGLWRLAAYNANSESYEAASGCAVTLQPVASQLQGVETWQALLQQWQQDEQLQQLPVCYLPLQTVESTELACTEQHGQRIHCNYQPLDNLVAKGKFSQLVVIAGRGSASYNNGVIHLPEQAGLALLRHEFMHILGFIDEYVLSAAAATEVCRSNRIRPNLIIGEGSEPLRRYLQHWQLNSDSVKLTPVSTCQALDIPVYRIVAEVNLMQYYETALPSLYYELMQQILSQPQQLMPVQYYFAYLARQRQDWPAWQQFMQQAAGQGYADAEQALQ